MYKFIQFTLVALVGITVTTVLLIAVARQSARRGPDFYRRAMQQEPLGQSEAGAELEREILKLHNQTRFEGHWEASFTADQINGWLAHNLENKFPNVVPPQFQNCRVAIETDKLRLACLYNDPPMESVLSMDVDVHLTDQPNIIAVQIEKARAGVWPVPLVQVLNTVSNFAMRAEFDLTWANSGQDPVALITIPEHREDLKKLLYLDILEVRDGKVYLSGRTETNQDTEESPIDEQPLISRTEDVSTLRK